MVIDDIQKLTPDLLEPEPNKEEGEAA